MSDIERATDLRWINRGHSVSIDVPDSPDVELLHECCDASFAEFKRVMNHELFGDHGTSTPWSDRPLSYKLGWYFETARGRIKDAWAVLTGKAEIGDGW